MADWSARRGRGRRGCCLRFSARIDTGGGSGDAGGAHGAEAFQEIPSIRLIRHENLRGHGGEVYSARQSPITNHKWLIRLAMHAAPKPLSIFTTDTPFAQLFSIPSSAATPPKLAP